MPLSDTATRNAKPKDKPYKLTDERGLYLLINQTGKYWRLDYRFEGKRKTFALGVYPDVSLKCAREKRDKARRMLADGVDPCAKRKAAKADEAAQTTNSFKAVALEYFAVRGKDWSERHRKRLNADMERDVFPWIGERPIHEITSPELLAVFKRIVDRGAEETARRAREVCGSIFRYGMATGRKRRKMMQSWADYLDGLRNGADIIPFRRLENS